MQELVEGRLEYGVSSGKLGIDVIFNEEYLVLGLKPNINSISPYIGGNIIFAGVSEEGDTISLNDEQIEYIESQMNDIFMY